MRTLVIAALLTTAATNAKAQAWLPAKGETTVSFVFSDSFVDKHQLNADKEHPAGEFDPNSNIYTKSMLADVTFGLRDDVAITVSLPIVRSKFVTDGTPAHPSDLDNGAYHNTVTDLRLDVRYNALNRRGLVVTPFITATTPSHSYEFFAHAAPGRRISELQVGSYVATTLDGIVPNTFVQAKYAYGVQERFVDITRNRSLFSLEAGHFATQDIRVFGTLNGHFTHGGRDITRNARLNWPDLQWVNHDRIANEDLIQAGMGLGWTISDTLDVFGSYSTSVYSINTHVLDRAFIVGASFRLQKSALERGILSANTGRRVARCACQKALALRR